MVLGDSMNKIVYIADDDQNIRELICSFLQSEEFTVVAFEDGNSLLRAFIERQADMVILDIMMPGTDGLTLCSKIREISNVPIIIVSARDSEIDRITGITLGSDDYLTKPFSPMELIARVKAIFRRMSNNNIIKEQSVLSAGNMRINLKTREVFIDESIIQLTPTEFALVAYFLKNKDKALSREELLKNVWQYDFDVETRATDDVIKRLRKKLQNSTVRISAVWGYGFKLEVCADEND